MIDGKGPLGGPFLLKKVQRIEVSKLEGPNDIGGIRFRLRLGL